MDPDTNEEEREYPLDAVFLGGRIVGELEIDFVRVSHQKNAFDKLDPQWSEVVKFIRGESPLRPNIARAREFEANTSILAQLYTGYRYGYAGLKYLVSGHRDGRARNDREFHEWTERFRRGEPEYQDDHKWYELAQLADQPEEESDSFGDEDDAFPIADTDSDSPSGGQSTESEEHADDANGETRSAEAIIYHTDENLSGVYNMPDMPGGPSISVAARSFTGSESSPPLRAKESGTTLSFDHDPKHSFFRDDLESPTDCLIGVLAHQFLYLAAASQERHPIPIIERELRERYFPETRTTLAATADAATDTLSGLRLHLAERLTDCDPTDPDSIGSLELALVRSGILSASLGDEQDTLNAFRTGEFIQYVSLAFLESAVERWPSLLLDGAFFAVPYANVSDEHRSEGISMVTEALRDAVWFVSDAGIGALNRDYQWRLRIKRADSSVRLLEFWRR